MSILGVVIPIYNKEMHLSHCIDSVLKQTMSDLQIVLVDDGSTDNSGEICDKYAADHKNVSVIHQCNQGPIWARYAGVLFLDCEYITFVDADDWIDPDTYEALTPYMEDSIDCIQYNISRYIDQTDHIVQNSLEPGIYNEHYLREKVYGTMLWNTRRNGWDIDPSVCNKVIKRQFWIDEYQLAKDLRIHYGEDMAVVYPILTKIKTYAVSKDGLYHHRKRDKGDLAAYLVDDNFYRNLLVLYEYLIRRLPDSQIFQKQLDYFFVESSKLHTLMYQSVPSGIRYYFPYHLVPVNSRIILYGAGRIGRDYKNQIQKLNYASIVLWADINYESFDDNMGVSDPGRIDPGMIFDYIVIAIKDKITADNIKIGFVNLGVPDNKIIWSIVSVN